MDLHAFTCLSATHPVGGWLSQILFKGVPIKVGISYGLPVLRRPVRATGRANYQGPVVQLGVRSMLSACPGQV